MRPYYRIYRVGSSSPMPVRHATPALAATEAERLAAQHPGDTFEVLQCLAVTRTTTPVTFWLDGCGPSQVAAATLPPPPEPGYIEITDPEEIIREGDECACNLTATWGTVGILRGDLVKTHPTLRFRRPDPTRQVVSIPAEYLPLPPLPEGKTQWVGRGTFADVCYAGGDREVRYFGTRAPKWYPTPDFDMDLFHIEAI